MKVLSRLTLQKFGKFVDKAFDFSDITVFRGDNETGKTTLFDAISVALCGGAATIIPGPCKAK